MRIFQVSYEQAYPSHHQLQKDAFPFYQLFLKFIPASKLSKQTLKSRRISLEKSSPSFQPKGKFFHPAHSKPKLNKKSDKVKK